MNVQYAIKDDVVYVLEVNPRAVRTVPFVSKATGVPVARLAAQVMAGRTSGGTEFHRDAGSRWLLCEGSRAAVQEISGLRLSAGTGDEIYRRGDGARRRTLATPLPRRRSRPARRCR